MNGDSRGYAKGRATRRLIVDHAVQLFGEVGYRSTSLREIAARAGISHPGLLHHFPSKAALLAAVLDRRLEEDGERYLPAESGLDQLRRLLVLVEHNTRVPAIVELHTTLSSEATDPAHPAHGWFVERYEVTRARFEAVLTRARADGVLRADVDPRTAAVALAALMDGLQVQWLLDRTAVDMVAVLRDHLERLLTRPL